MERPDHLDVQHLMKEKNCYFVHTIQVTKELDVSQNNKVLDTKNLTTQDRLDLLYAASPTLSVSTLRPHTEDGTFYGGFGVVFSQGEIVSAHPGDTGSIAHSLTERTLIGEEAKDAPEDIDRAIDRVNGGGKSYNEIVLKSPEIAGGFLKLGSFGDRITYETTVAEYGAGGGSVEGDVGILNLENDKKTGRNFDTVLKTLEEMKFYGPIFLMDDNNELHIVNSIDGKARKVAFSSKSFSPANLAEVYENSRMDSQTKEALRDRLKRRNILKAE